jgi:hypothetical protein
MVAHGLSPIFSAFFSFMSTTATAVSFIPEAFPRAHYWEVVA